MFTFFDKNGRFFHQEPIHACRWVHLVATFSVGLGFVGVKSSLNRIKLLRLPPIFHINLFLAGTYCTLIMYGCFSFHWVLCKPATCAVVSLVAVAIWCLCFILLSFMTIIRCNIFFLGLATIMHRKSSYLLLVIMMKVMIIFNCKFYSWLSNLISVLRPALCEEQNVDKRALNSSEERFSNNYATNFQSPCLVRMGFLAQLLALNSPL